MAQITITDADFASPGDTAMVSFSDDFGIDFVSTGPSTVWDFSAINISAQAIDTFHDVSDSDVLFQLVFNNWLTYPDNLSDWYNDWDAGGLATLSQFGVDIDRPVRFTAVTNNEVRNTGFGFYVQGNGIPALSDTVDIQYELPINYGDSWTSYSYTHLDLNPTIDAIWIRHQDRNSIVDGWGQISTPFGTFDAVRVKSLVSSTDSLYAGMLGSWFELPNPNVIEYHWFTNGQKMPVFSVITNDVGGNETVSQVSFKDKYRTFASNDELNFDGKIYPNPAENEVVIQTHEPAQKIEIYSVSGQLVYAEIPLTNAQTVEVSSWDAGLYLVKVHTKQGVSTTKLIVD